MIAWEGEVACFGELILRLSPTGRQLLAPSTLLETHPGGAEANVAITLAGLGHSCRMISRVPANGLGAMAIRALRAGGVDCGHVTTGPGRMALYFLAHGAGVRASEIVYDRADSAFARASADDFDWSAAFAGVGLLHLSGIVPALGPGSAELAIAAAREAQARGILVSFDGNYRSQLWAAWPSDPRAILRELVDLADILFGNHRDIGLLLDRTFPSETAADRRVAAEAALVAFPRLRVTASTARAVEHAGFHRLSVRVDTRDEAVETAELELSDIVDRIGTGDAFAAGVLHGLAGGAGGVARGAEFGLALTALKHSAPGDAVSFGPGDVEHFLAGTRDVRR